MVNNEALNTIVDDVLHRQLGKAIAHLENYLYTLSSRRPWSSCSRSRATTS